MTPKMKDEELCGRATKDCVLSAAVTFPPTWFPWKRITKAQVPGFPYDIDFVISVSSLGSSSFLRWKIRSSKTSRESKNPLNSGLRVWTFLIGRLHHERHNSHTISNFAASQFHSKLQMDHCSNQWDSNCDPFHLFMRYDAPTMR